MTYAQRPKALALTFSLPAPQPPMVRIVGWWAVFNINRHR